MIKFATVRLGKTSVDDIKRINSLPSGILSSPIIVPVICTQVPLELETNTIIFLWFGSDNAKGMPTEWKQGFKAVGTVVEIIRGASFNSETTTKIRIEYVFSEAINRLDILRDASSAYFNCANLPIIGIDDHSNQTIRIIDEKQELGDSHAFLYALNKVHDTFKTDICQIHPELTEYFYYYDKRIEKYVGLNARQSISETSYLPYLTALRTKPFMLLAGISGTGKSRIVREMAKACWTPEEDEYGKNCPRNFCMVQVKPNWHDSSDLIGYVSRINGEKYVVGPFLRFIAKAVKDPKRPYFLCLDEMNLAPVEQYFAEYLSVIESRKLQDGHIETDPIVPYENTEAYGSLIDQLFDSDEERKAYKTEEGGKRLTIPENLFVVGTVNMDETTFSFSRKVLDRAMTIEMNEVNLHGGLEAGGSAEFGYIGEDLMGDAAEGKDIYADNQTLCDDIITYLGKVNEILEGTPFKIAYRTRNEFLLYAVNRLHFATDSELWQTLDEMTSMKILSRIEGDNERCERVLREMKQLLTETVGEHASDSVSLKKIDEMTLKLKSGYTSYWT